MRTVWQDETSYYQRLNYKYEEYAEESIVLDLIAELRAEMGRMGGRKLWHEINAANPGLIAGTGCSTSWTSTT